MNFEDVFKFIQSQLIEKDLDEQKRLLNLLLTFEPRNLAYKKSNYDLWSEDDKNQFMDLATDECHINNNHFLEKINYDFFNEVN